MSFIWRDGVPYQAQDDGQYATNRAAELCAFAALRDVAGAASALLDGSSTSDITLDYMALESALEAAGFDTARGTWRTEAP